jgi:hypothetical protein
MTKLMSDGRRQRVRFDQAAGKGEGCSARSGGGQQLVEE